jgi:2-(1,2-epoxy-1,2-dihydrophenyl)acetyl-CoA isomerase
MAYEMIELDINDDGVALLKLNRPKVLNSLNAPLMDEMRSALAAISEDDDARAVVLTGNGRGFCAGADLGGGDMKPGVSVGEAVAQSMEDRFNPLVRDLFHLNKPLVAAINGTTAGGGVGVALTADIAIAARSASFKLTFVPRLGIVPDCGASFFLQRTIGRARALGLSMLGESLPAEQAAEWGLIWSCVDDDKLMDEAMSIAARLAAGPTLAFPRLRSVVAAAEHNTLDQQLDLERDTQRILGDSEDFMEGTMAFLQKRKPKFKGR